MNHDSRLKEKLDQRFEENSLRKLEAPDGLIDFCSNDYLGFSRSKELSDKIDRLDVPEIRNLVGSGASRLISANNPFAEKIEQNLCQLLDSQSALLFNSGYNSNLGFFGAVPQRGDVVIYDEFIHASIRDGLKMGLARSFSFAHNSLADLTSKIDSVDSGVSIFVVVESVYSMDGDSPDLVSVANLCEQRNCHLVVDEAHAFGVFGEHGEGRVVELGIQDQVYARIITFGKALGCHGAAILGSATLVSYLVNYARSLIYTTMMSVGDQKAIFCALDHMSNVEFKSLKTKKLINLFKSLIEEKGLELISSESNVQSIVFSGVEEVKNKEQNLRDNGFWVKAILSPTVPKGMERIRVCIHEFNTEEEVRKLVNCL